MCLRQSELWKRWFLLWSQQTRRYFWCSHNRVEKNENILCEKKKVEERFSYHKSPQIHLNGNLGVCCSIWFIFFFRRLVEKKNKNRTQYPKHQFTYSILNDYFIENQVNVNDAASIIRDDERDKHNWVMPLLLARRKQCRKNSIHTLK